MMIIISQAIIKRALVCLVCSVELELLKRKLLGKLAYISLPLNILGLMLQKLIKGNCNEENINSIVTLLISVIINSLTLD